MEQFSRLMTRLSPTFSLNHAAWLVVGAVMVLVSTAPAMTQTKATGPSGFVVPRFVSLGVGRANLRVGPKQSYPIDWVYQRKGLPLEIIKEHESWRRVRDLDGAEGWMHKQLLVGRRTGIVIADWAEIRDQPDDLSFMVIRAEQGVQISVDECQLDWCLVGIDGNEGWVAKTAIWGVYPAEIFD